MEKYLTYFVALIVILILFKFSKISTRKDTATLIFGVSKPRVLFHSTFHIPFIEKYHIVELGTRVFPISFRGQESLRCKDYIRSEIVADFYYRIRPDSNYIMKFLDERNGFSFIEPNDFYESLFKKSFKDVVAEFTYLEIFSDRVNFRNKILESAKALCSGIEIVDIAIDFVEQISLSEMDPNDQLDLKGIKTIESILARQDANDRV